MNMPANTPARILHIAPQNISDVPMTFVRAERRLGFTSRLVTFFPDSRGYPEDYCLHLPLVSSSAVSALKRRFAPAARMAVGSQSRTASGRVPVWRPSGQAERAFFWLRERLWTPRLRRMQKELDFWNYDLYHFDAGLDFFRDGRTARRLKALGKTIVVCYTGSDLRTRGVIEAVHNSADLRLTLEWDHLALDPSLTHLLFPFEAGKFAYRERIAGSTLRIGHAPTNRAAKGTATILAVLEQLAGEHTIEVVLIENKSHGEAIALKESCDIFIDQLSDLGYGINALEALALGVPTCTALAPAFVRAYPDHPFVHVTASNLYTELRRLIAHPEARLQLARRGRRWLQENHDSGAIVRRIHRLLNFTSEPAKLKS